MIEKLIFKLLGQMTGRVWSDPSALRPTPATLRHRYPGFSISLPLDHLLPTYQRIHPRYDRFLPHLANHMESGDLVLDVGANCGDTLAGMVAGNATLTYVCIEPDDGFFAFLYENAAEIRASTGARSIFLVKTLVGKAVAYASLGGVGGTKGVIRQDHLTDDEPQTRHQSMTLDDIVQAQFPEKRQRVRLLKSDVDGFDFDVIDSATQILGTDKPMLFFECQYGDAAQRNAYLETLARLTTCGYHDFWLFDNFGELLLHTTELPVVAQLIDYVWRQNSGGSTRTIYYFDILAATANDVDFLSDVVQKYIDNPVHL